MLTYRGSPYEVTNIGSIGLLRKLGFGISRGIVFGILCEQAGDGGGGYPDDFGTDGDRTIQMTKRYAHLAPVHNLDAVDRLVAYQTQQTSKEPKNAATEASATISATSSESAKASESVVVH